MKLEVFLSDDSALPLGSVKIGTKVLTLTRGIGSSLFHMAGDLDHVFYSVTDRGPNIDCAEAQNIIGMDFHQMCAGDDTAKIFPQPDFVPSIQRIELGTDGKFRISALIQLRDAAGMTITGLPNPLKRAKTERAYDRFGRPIDFDPNGLDCEGLIRLSDGTFWLAEEYAPGLVHVAADGKIIERLVPEGLESDFADTTYEVRAALPAIFAKRHLNRGIEGIAVSPDEKFLYAVLQNPLANPDEAAYQKANATRILKIETATGKPVAEFVYQLDPHTTFRRDPDSSNQYDVRLSEATAFAPDKLIVLERITKTTKLYLVDLASGSNILGTAWDDPETSPSLEQVDLVAAGVTPLAKTLWLDSSDHPDIPEKIEGVAIINPHTLVLVNDNDFGILGAPTQILRLKLALPDHAPA
jgi:hypothetical protein